MLLSLPAQAGDVLKKLHSSRGGAVIEYERAVAGSEEFAQLPRSAPAPAVVVAPASGTPGEEERAVTIRLYRQAADSGARAIVFEDAYSIRYPEGACRYDGVAAATVAAALAGNALSPEPLHVRFDSDPRRLRCDRP